MKGALLLVGIFLGCNSFLLSCSAHQHTESQRKAPEERAHLSHSVSSQDIHSFARGKKLYQFYCAGCHGDNGYGNGPENWDEDHPAPSLRELDQKSQLHCTSPWVRADLGTPLNNSETLEVTSYIRSLSVPSQIKARY